MERMTDEERKLAENNINLAYYFATKWDKELHFIEYEEIVSACLFALCKASKTFKKDAGATFGTYASRCINNEVLMLMRTNKKKHSKTTNFTDLGPVENSYNGQQERNTITDILEGLHHYDEYPIFYNLLIEDLLSRCTEKEKTIFVMRYSDVKQKEVGKVIGISQSYISRIMTNSKQKMSKYYKLKYA